jgi:N-acyl-D-amino-acid deacylase
MTHLFPAALHRWAAAVLVTLLLVLPSCAPPSGDLVVVNARIVDGTGTPAYQGGVRVADGVIVEVGNVEPLPGDSVLDADGMVLAPGFVDTHSHHDRGLFEEPDALAAVSQGITTIVLGQDGGSHLPLSEFFRRLEEEDSVAVNVASFSGHNTLRREVMGEDFRRPASEDEVHRMAELLREDLAAGALGLATGLEYDPGIYSATEEVLVLARMAAEEGGRYASHIRSEDRNFWEGIDELLLIGREVGIPVHVSHVKLAMQRHWGQADRLLRILDSARDAGIEVTADIYPYTYWQSTMTVLFPDRDFQDLDEARFVLQEITPADGLLVSRFEPNPEYEGMTLEEIARERDQEPALTLLELIAESQAAREAGDDGGESVIGRSMHEEDIGRLISWPHTNVASDGGLRGGHPRGFGAFPRVLAHHVRERGDLDLEGAIHRMSELGARHVGLEGRGRLAPGMPADLVLLDPERVRDRSTPTAPERTADGILRVWVNGVEVYRDGRTTGALPGQVLRRAR